MGIITSKLRKKKTTSEVLESIEGEIKSIEEFRRNTEQTHKRIVGRFVIISVGFYLVTTLLFYFYYFPANFYDRLFYVIPLILAPVIILLVKQILTWYYLRKIARKQNKLVSLRNEKKDILEKVMETETYKVAKSILDKFAPPEPVRKPPEATPIRALKLAVPNTINTGLRQRTISPTSQIQPTPIIKSHPITAVSAKPPIQGASTNQPLPIMGTPLPMPRAVLPRERSLFDKMLDYLVGDGPSNRYALICSSCYSHNGMAYRDEIEYFSFRCCYCYTFNPALKKRPVAPKFEYELKQKHVESSDSDSEKNSAEDSTSETDEGVVVLKSTSEVEKCQEDSELIEEFDTDKTENVDDNNTEVKDVRNNEEVNVEEILSKDSEIKD